MKSKNLVSLMLTALFVMSICIPVVSATPDDTPIGGVDLTVTILEPQPEIGITVHTTSIDFGALYPGELSLSNLVRYTNIGRCVVDVNVSVMDVVGDVFEAGILVNEADWHDYSATVLENATGEFDVALQVPEDVTSRGDVSGKLIVWAEECVPEETSTVNFLIQYADNSTEWISGTGVSLLDAWDDAITTAGYTYALQTGTYEGQVGTINGISGEGQEWWVAFTGDEVANEWTIGPDGSGYSAGLILANHAASEYSCVAFVYGNWNYNEWGPCVYPDGSVPASTVNFLIQYADNSTEWISGTGVSLLDAWDDAITTAGYTYALQTGTYEGQVGTINGISGEGQEWWVAFTGDEVANEWTIGPDGSGYSAGLILANHAASEYSCVAFVYGNWNYNEWGPCVDPNTYL